MIDGQEKNSIFFKEISIMGGGLPIFHNFFKEINAVFPENLKYEFNSLMIGLRSHGCHLEGTATSCWGKLKVLVEKVSFSKKVLYFWSVQAQKIRHFMLIPKTYINVC